MSGASSLRAALLTLVAALLTSLLIAPGTAAAAPAPEPSEDHPWLPRSCVAGPDEYVPDRPGPCHLTPFKKNRPTVVLWGDSHAWQHLPAVSPLAKERKVNLVMFMLGGCPPILVGERTRQKLYACETSNQMALKYVRGLNDRGNQPVRVLMGAFWDGYYTVYKGVYEDGTIDPDDYTTTQLRSARTFNRLTPRLIAKLGEIGVRTDLIGQAVTVPIDPPFCRRGGEPYKCALKRSVALPREKAWQNWFRRVMRPLPDDSRVVNFNGPYCGPKKCQGFTKGIYTYFDQIHLSATRTATFKKFFAPSFRGLG